MRLSTSSFSRRRETCALTVGTLMCRRAAMAALACPSPTASATSSSRGLSAWPAARAPRRRLKRPRGRSGAG